MLSLNYDLFLYKTLLNPKTLKLYVVSYELLVLCPKDKLNFIVVSLNYLAFNPIISHTLNRTEHVIINIELLIYF